MALFTLVGALVAVPMVASAATPPSDPAWAPGTQAFMLPVSGGVSNTSTEQLVEFANSDVTVAQRMTGRTGQAQMPTLRPVTMTLGEFQTGASGDVPALGMQAGRSTPTGQRSGTVDYSATLSAGVPYLLIHVSNLDGSLLKISDVTTTDAAVAGQIRLVSKNDYTSVEDNGTDFTINSAPRVASGGGCRGEVAPGRGAGCGTVAIYAPEGQLVTGFSLRNYAPNLGPTSGDGWQMSYSIPVAHLSVSKSADVQTAQPGDVIAYNVQAVNDGELAYQADSRLAVVTDDVSDVLTVASYNDDAVATLINEDGSADGNAGPVSFDPDTQTLSWTGPLEPGQRVSIDYTVTLGKNGDGDLTNVACVSNPGEDDSCAPATVGTPDIETSKSVESSADPVVAGSVLTYTLTFQNTGTAPGPIDYTDHLADVLDDADLAGDPEVSDDALSVAVGDQSLHITGELDAGQTATVAYRVTVNDEVDRGNNTADNFLVPTGEKPSGTCTSDDPNCTVTPLPDVVPSKSADPESGSTVVAGQDVTYTLTFRNDGKAAGPVDYSDDLAKVLDDADLTGAPTVSDDVLSATSGEDGVIRVTGELQPGQTATVSYTVTVKADGARGDNRLGNFLVKTGDEPPARCKTDDPNCTEHPVPEIIDSKSVDPASGTTVAPGQELTYTLTFTNKGQGSGEVDKVDNLTHVLDDAKVTSAPVSSDPALKVGAVENDQYSITGTVGPNQTVTVTYKVTVDSPDEGDRILANFLLPKGEKPPSDPRDCQPVAGQAPDCTINPVSDIEATKSVDPESGSQVKDDQELTYTLTFANTGEAAGKVDYVDSMTDVLDDATVTTAPAASDAALQVATGDHQLRITGELAVGQTVTVTYTVTVKAYDEQGDHHLANFLTLHGHNPPTSCDPDSRLCTENPVASDPVAPTGDGLALTGASILVPLTGGLLAVLAGLVMLIGAKHPRWFGRGGAGNE